MLKDCLEDLPISRFGRVTLGGFVESLFTVGICLHEREEGCFLLVGFLKDADLWSGLLCVPCSKCLSIVQWVIPSESF